jgi:hypothetical protein
VEPQPAAHGAFWRADVDGWAGTPGATTRFAAERAPDRTPELAFGCGATCGGGVYQDVEPPAGLAGETLAFGGSVRADGGAGVAELSVEQFDAAGAPIATRTLPISLGAAYARTRATVEVDRRTERLRLTITPRSPGTLRADNLYLIPQVGCDARRYPAC